MLEYSHIASSPLIVEWLLSSDRGMDLINFILPRLQAETKASPEDVEFTVGIRVIRQHLK